MPHTSCDPIDTSASNEVTKIRDEIIARVRVQTTVVLNLIDKSLGKNERIHKEVKFTIRIFNTKIHLQESF
jgi:hypothetical protein